MKTYMYCFIASIVDAGKKENLKKSANLKKQTNLRKCNIQDIFKENGEPQFNL